MATKHQSWLFLPFYFLYLLLQRPQIKGIKKLIYFIIFPILFGLPMFLLMLWRQWKHDTTYVDRFCHICFCVPIFSRFFNDNYFIFVAQCLVIALFMFPFQYIEHEETQDESTRGSCLQGVDGFKYGRICHTAPNKHIANIMNQDQVENLACFFLVAPHHVVNCFCIQMSGDAGG